MTRTVAVLDALVPVDVDVTSAAKTLLDDAEAVALENPAVLDVDVTAAAEAPTDDVELVLACVLVVTRMS